MGEGELVLKEAPAIRDKKSSCRFATEDRDNPVTSSAHFVEKRDLGHQGFRRLLSPWSTRVPPLICNPVSSALIRQERSFWLFVTGSKSSGLAGLNFLCHLCFQIVTLSFSGVLARKLLVTTSLIFLSFLVLAYWPLPLMPDLAFAAYSSR